MLWLPPLVCWLLAFGQLPSRESSSLVQANDDYGNPPFLASILDRILLSPSRTGPKPATSMRGLSQPDGHYLSPDQISHALIELLADQPIFTDEMFSYRIPPGETASSNPEASSVVFVEDLMNFRSPLSWTKVFVSKPSDNVVKAILASASINIAFKTASASVKTASSTVRETWPALGEPRGRIPSDHIIDADGLCKLLNAIWSWSFADPVRAFCAVGFSVFMFLAINFWTRLIDPAEVLELRKSYREFIDEGLEHLTETEEHQESIRKLTESNDRLAKDVENAAEAKKDAYDQHEETTKHLRQQIESLEKDKSDLVSKNDAFKSEEKRLSEALKSSQAVLDKERKEVAVQTKKLDELQRNLADHEAVSQENTRLAANAASHEKTIANLKAKNGDLSKQVQQVALDLGKAQIKIKKLEQSCAKKDQDIKDTEARQEDQVTQLTQEKDTALYEVKSGADQIRDLEDTLQRTRERSHAAEDTISTLTEEKKAVEAELAKSRKVTKTLSAKLTAAGRKQDELQEQAKEASRSLEEEEKHHDELSTAYDKLDKEKIALEVKLETYMSDLRASKKLASANWHVVKDHELTIKALISNKETQIQQHEHDQATIKDLASSRDDFQALSTRLQNQLDQVREQHATLQSKTQKLRVNLDESAAGWKQASDDRQFWEDKFNDAQEELVQALASSQYAEKLHSDAIEKAKAEHAAALEQAVTQHKKNVEDAVTSHNATIERIKEREKNISSALQKARTDFSAESKESSRNITQLESRNKVLEDDKLRVEGEKAAADNARLVAEASVRSLKRQLERAMAQVAVGSSTAAEDRGNDEKPLDVQVSNHPTPALDSLIELYQGSQSKPLAASAEATEKMNAWHLSESYPQTQDMRNHLNPVALAGTIVPEGVTVTAVSGVQTLDEKYRTSRLISADPRRGDMRSNTRNQTYRAATRSKVLRYFKHSLQAWDLTEVDAGDLAKGQPNTLRNRNSSISRRRHSISYGERDAVMVKNIKGVKAPRDCFVFGKFENDTTSDAILKLIQATTPIEKRGEGSTRLRRSLLPREEYLQIPAKQRHQLTADFFDVTAPGKEGEPGLPKSRITDVYGLDDQRRKILYESKAQHFCESLPVPSASSGKVLEYGFDKTHSVWNGETRIKTYHDTVMALEQEVRKGNDYINSTSIFDYDLTATDLELLSSVGSGPLRPLDFLSEKPRPFFFYATAVEKYGYFHMYHGPLGRDKPKQKPQTIFQPWQRPPWPPRPYHRPGFNYSQPIRTPVMGPRQHFPQAAPQVPVRGPSASTKPSFMAQQPPASPSSFYFGTGAPNPRASAFNPSATSSSTSAESLDSPTNSAINAVPAGPRSMGNGNSYWAPVSNVSNPFGPTPAAPSQPAVVPRGLHISRNVSNGQSTERDDYPASSKQVSGTPSVSATATAPRAVTAPIAPRAAPILSAVPAPRAPPSAPARPNQPAAESRPLAPVAPTQHLRPQSVPTSAQNSAVSGSAVPQQTVVTSTAPTTPTVSAASVPRIASTASAQQPSALTTSRWAADGSAGRIVKGSTARGANAQQTPRPANHPPANTTPASASTTPAQSQRALNTSRWATGSGSSTRGGARNIRGSSSRGRGGFGPGR